MIIVIKKIEKSNLLMSIINHLITINWNISNLEANVVNLLL